MGNAPVTEMARDSGVQGLTDKVSASRPASCGESGVDVADANASHADLKGSAPAASATGPAGLEGGGEASQVGGEVGGEAGSRAQGKANSHQLGKAESR